MFVGAMAESVFFPAQPRVNELEYQFNKTTENLGCKDEKDQMGCLRGKDIKAIQEANAGSPFPGRQLNPHFYWTPCIDGHLIQDYPYAMYDQGKFIKVPVLFGTGSNGKCCVRMRHQFSCSPIFRGIRLRSKRRDSRSVRKLHDR